jgi:hypothetical protein
MTERKEALAASLVIVAMLSVALITAATAPYRPTLGENNEYQFPWGTGYLRISGNVTSGWYNATLTFSNGSTRLQISQSGEWAPTKDWLQRADLPWVLYIPPTGSPQFWLDATVYYNEPFGLWTRMNLTHIGYTYVCRIGSSIPGNLTIKWDDRSGMLTEVDSGNSALVYLVGQNL